MFDAGRRPNGRLFYWVLTVVIAASGFQLSAFGAEPVPQSGPATSTVSDTVYLANGATASGTLIITWPAFVTASGAAVAGGVMNVTLGTNGALSVALVPNVGATPAGVYYTVIYQIGPGEVKTEYWVVPTTSPVNLAGVITTPGSGTAAQPVSMQYVNTQLAGVVHLTGAETITGAKVFSISPNVPTPTNTGDVASKGYVDQSVSTVGGGTFLPTAGGTMLGPITLPSNLTQAPQFEYLGWGEQGAVYRYDLIAESDEVLLDQKALPNRAPFVGRTIGGALTQLAQDLLPGVFNTSAVQNVDTLAEYAVNPEKKFSYHAAEIALTARASYRAMNEALVLAPVGAATYAINESDPNFSPLGLKLKCPKMLVNDVTAIGLLEPQAYVRDYFVADGLSVRFYLSQTPFQQSKPALIDEEYVGPGLDATTWVVNDPSSAVSVVSQTLQVAGGAGEDGQTSVAFIEQIEMGGALELQHGDVSFTGSSTGVVGGLYAGAISAASCLAGFQVTPSGSGSYIQALINGMPTGSAVATTAGHRYVLTTYIYSMEVYRSEETYHSSVHPAGSGLGGAAVAADLRLVLELQDIDPSNPATLVAAATVLFDGVIANAPGFCTYALVNATSMQCSIAYTYVTHISLAEVRTALSETTYNTLADVSFTTQIVGSLSDGAECEIASSTTLDFYPAYVPALNTLIVVSYRGSGRAAAEVVNSASVDALQSGADNGARGIVRLMKTPSARTQADCENAALAILDDATGLAWLGTYETWSDFLPSAASDIFPGDAVTVNVPSRNAVFSAIVRTVSIEVADPADDRGMYTIEFANDLAVPLALQDASSATTVSLQDMPVQLSTSQVGSYYLANLTEAQITAVSSTTVSVDAGVIPPTLGGVEVRLHDYGWGVANDRNLLGRFSTQTFSLARLARTQTYFMRLYDNSSPPRYSRYAAALHVDYPL